MIDRRAAGLLPRKLGSLDFDMIRIWGELGDEGKTEALAILDRFSASAGGREQVLSGPAETAKVTS